MAGPITNLEKFQTSYSEIIFFNYGIQAIVSITKKHYLQPSNYPIVVNRVTSYHELNKFRINNFIIDIRL